MLWKIQHYPYLKIHTSQNQYYFESKYLKIWHITKSGYFESKYYILWLNDFI